MRLIVLAPLLLLFACAQGNENAASDPQELNAALNGEAPAGRNPGAPAGQQPSTAPPAAEQPGEISFSASPEKVDAGATVLLSLANGTGEPLGYNLCTSTLQSADGTEMRSDRACTMELRILEPGGSTTYSFDLPGILEDGTYRFSTDLQRMNSGARAAVTSNSIEIR